MKPPRIRNFVAETARKAFELDGKSAVISFRIIILLLALFFTVYNQKLVLTNAQIDPAPFFSVLFIAFFHLTSNVFVAYAPDRFLRKGFFTGVFIFDVLLISTIIYLTQGFESDLFLIYFLVIFMTVVSRQAFASFAVAGLGCVLYGFLFLKAHSMDELMHSSVMIRFPLFMVVAFFSHIIVEDIEEEKKELRESEERFRQLAEHIREAFWMTDAEKTRVIYVSPVYEDIWGRPRQRLYDSPGLWMETVHPEDRPRVEKAAAEEQGRG